MIQTNPITTIQKNLTPLQARIATHPLIPRLGEAEILCYFMSQHVFVVWDFVNLIKTLHSRLTQTQLVWLPSDQPNAVRLLYEILMEEEADVDPNAPEQHCSHLELYLRAMAACGADTSAFDTMVADIKSGKPWELALLQADILPSTTLFVQQTLKTCKTGSLMELAASFVFGREAMVPDLFTPWLAALKHNNCMLRFEKIAPLVHYLQRHIELDSESHFPKAAQMLHQICGDREACWATVQKAAEAALTARLDFLEGIAAAVEAVAVDQHTLGVVE